MVTSRPSFSIFLASLFIVTILPMGEGADTTPLQDAAVVAALGKAPQGTWQVIEEFVRLYGTGAATPAAPRVAQTTTTAPTNASFPQNATLYAPGVNATTNLTFNLSSSPMGKTTGDMTLRQLDITLYLRSCAAHTVSVQLMLNGAPSGPVIEVKMTGLVPQEPLPQAPPATSPPAPYTATSPPDYSVFVPAGSNLAVRLTPVTPTAAMPQQQVCALTAHWGQGGAAATLRDTNFRFRSDSVRLNTWTEDKTKVASSFPKASTVGSEERFFRVRLVQVNAWNLTAEPTVAITNATGVAATGFVRLPGFVAGIKLVPGLMLTTLDYAYPFSQPDGPYNVRLSAGTRWSIEHTITLGGAAFTLGLATGEAAAHTVKVGEATNFMVRVQNTGVAPDNIAIAVDALTGGWTGTLSAAAISLAPGQADEIILTVTPPATAVSGDSKNITVRAVSSVTGLTKTQMVNVTLTNSDNPGVLVTTLASSVQTRPGLTKTVAVTVRNTGFARDDFLMTASGAPAGWIVTADPGSLRILSQSQATVLVNIKAPVDAAAGQAFLLNVKASRLTNALISHSKDLPVSVFFVDDYGLTVDGLTTAVHSIRDEGPDSTPADAAPFDSAPDGDRDYDQTTLYRLVLENKGDQSDTITLTASWANVKGDSVNCDGSSTNERDDVPDGVPDGWRFGFDAKGNATTLSANAQDGTPALPTKAIVVAARETRYVNVELGWLVPTTGPTPPPGLPIDPPTDPPTGCNETGGGDFAASQGELVDEDGDPTGAREFHPAKAASIMINSTSTNDPTVKRSVTVTAMIVPHDGRSSSQNYAGANPRGVSLEPMPGEDLDGVAEANSQVLHQMRAVNKGREMDDILLTVPGPTNGFTYSIIGLNESLMFSNQGQGTGAGQFTAKKCQALNTQLTQVRCTMGAFDEVGFTIKVTTPAAAPIGTLQFVEVSASSADSLRDTSVVRDPRTITTTVTGKFAFTTVRHVTLQVAYPGLGAALPFTLSNIGTSGDTYTLVALSLPTGWSASFSAGGSPFVAAGKPYHGFIAVTPPASAQLNQAQLVRMRVDSAGGAPSQAMDFFVTPRAPPASLGLVGTPPEIVAAPGVEADLAVRATRLSGTETSVTFTVDNTTLPAGWILKGNSVVAGKQSFTATFVSQVATATFKVTAPTGGIDTSRAVVNVLATTATVNRTAQVIVNLASGSFGLSLQSPTGTTQLLASGDRLQIPLLVVNNGASTDTIILATSGTPTGWTARAIPPALTLQPLESGNFMLEVTSPDNLAPGASIPLFVTAASQGIPANTASLQMTLLVVTSTLEVTPLGNATKKAGPLEAVTFAVAVKNNGTVSDEIELSAPVSSAYQGTVKVAFSIANATLRTNQSIQFEVTVTLPGDLASGSLVRIPVEARSAGALSSVGSTNFTVQLYRYASLDVDGDRHLEYAVDRNDDLVGSDRADGLEEFSDPIGEGVNSIVADLEGFLKESARARFVRLVPGPNNATVEEFRYFIDGDADNRTDFFLDLDGDQLVDRYWDPDSGTLYTTSLHIDLNKDGVRDIITDTSGDGLPDKYYDLAEGRFWRLINVDVNDDGVTDFVADLNDNGRADADEPILFGGPGGRIIRVQQLRDVDGDGEDDLVVDEDGDGEPDFFVPHGKSKGIEITLEDVTGDGVADWTYDADGDGRRDSYFNPVTGETGLIDEKASLMQDLQEYWYVGALFGVVLLLFLVLMIVTRR